MSVPQAIVDMLLTLKADIRPPTVPVISATATSPTAITVGLTTASTDSGSGVATYSLDRATNTGFTVGLVTTSSIAPGDFPLAVTGLDPSTTYYFRLRATDAQENTGNPSGTASATTQALDVTAPTAPVISVSAISASSIVVTLVAPSTDAGSGVASYTLQRATDLAFTSNLTTTNGVLAGTFPLTVSGLASSTQYYFRLRAVDGAANTGAFGATVNATTQSAIASRSVLIQTNTPGAYQHGRLITTPSTFGSGEFCIGIYFKATNTGTTAALTDGTIGSANQRNAWQTASLTRYSSTLWWTHNNFLMDGHNNTTGQIHNGTFSLGFHASGRPVVMFGDGSAAQARVGGVHGIAPTTGASVLDGNWHCIEFNRSWTGASSALLTLRVDGVVVGTETSTARTDMRTFWNTWSGFSEPGLYFMAEKWAATNRPDQPQWSNAKGYLGEIRLWNRSVPDSESATAWNDLVTGSETGLVGRYPFTESSGSTVANSLASGQPITLFNASSTWAADGPTLEAPSGTLVHGQPFTVSGSGFGAKSPAAPLVWDNCSHGQATSARWAAAFPSTGGANRVMTYRTPGSAGLPSDALPHSNITHVLSGCHFSGGGDGGYNVGMSFPVTFAEGQPVFTRYLFRNSTGFYYDSGSENYKIWHWDQAAGPYASSTDGYLEFKDFTSSGSSPTYKYNSGYHFVSPDELGNTATNYHGGVTGSTPGNQWTEHKLYWLLDRNNGGACYVVANNANAWSGATRPTSGNVRIPNVTIGKMAFYYHGQTVPSSGSTIYGQIGGFARYNDNGTSFRMFADIYVDTTWSRVELANNATYDSATITEPQPPTSWSSSSVTATCNKGRLSAGTVHVFVFDSANNRQYLGTRTMS